MHIKLARTKIIIKHFFKNNFKGNLFCYFFLKRIKYNFSFLLATYKMGGITNSMQSPYLCNVRVVFN